MTISVAIKGFRRSASALKAYSARTQKEESPRPESPYHAFGPRSLGIEPHSILINHPRPPQVPAPRLLLLFRPSQAPEQGGLGPVNSEPTGQG